MNSIKFEYFIQILEKIEKTGNPIYKYSAASYFLVKKLFIMFDKSISEYLPLLPKLLKYSEDE
jgi:hypothetical protein